MLTQEEHDLCAVRSNQIDYSRIASLHYLGNYTRELPVNMTRMMENAYDWEHLPFVHESSFSSISLIASGKWGWRARIGIPGGGIQLLDLIIDLSENYWVSTVISGPGEGTEIHTKATNVTDETIEVDVRFYLPEAPADQSVQEFVLKYLQDQYRRLYDEDQDLMSGRQEALDTKANLQKIIDKPEIQLVGNLAALNKDASHITRLGKQRYAVRFHQDEWIAHGATCPHMLGPLQDSVIDASRTVTCPWHGYRFDIESGDNLDGKCASLGAAPTVFEDDGQLFLKA